MFADYEKTSFCMRSRVKRRLFRDCARYYKHPKSQSPCYFYVKLKIPILIEDYRESGRKCLVSFACVRKVDYIVLNRLRNVIHPNMNGVNSFTSRMKSRYPHSVGLRIPLIIGQKAYISLVPKMCVLNTRLEGVKLNISYLELHTNYLSRRGRRYEWKKQ